MKSAAVVVKIAGEAFAVRDGKEIALTQDAEIFVTDEIRTSGGAKVEIRFHDETEVSIGPDSQIQVSDFSYDASGTPPPSFAMHVVEGLVRTATGQVVKMNPEAFSVTTPLGTAGIRGTVIWTNVNDKAVTFTVTEMGRGHSVVVATADGRNMLITAPGAGVGLSSDSGSGINIKQLSPSELMDAMQKMFSSDSRNPSGSQGFYIAADSAFLTAVGAAEIAENVGVVSMENVAALQNALEELGVDAEIAALDSVFLDAFADISGFSGASVAANALSPSYSSPAPSQPETSAPGTPDPGNPDPSNPDPSNPDPSAPDPGNPDPGNPDPSTPDPSNPDPSDPDPSNPVPGNPDPSTPDPSTPDPGTTDPTDPTDPDPGNPDPGTPEPSTPEFNYVYGTDGDDNLTSQATSGRDWIYLKNGNDIVDAGHDNDVIESGDGTDRITGGRGADKIVKTGNLVNSIIIGDTQTTDYTICGGDSITVGMKGGTNTHTGTITGDAMILENNTGPADDSIVIHGSLEVGGIVMGEADTIRGTTIGTIPANWDVHHGNDTFTVTTVNGGVIYGDARLVTGNLEFVQGGFSDIFKIGTMANGAMYGDFEEIGSTASLTLNGHKAFSDSFTITTISGGKIYGDVGVITADGFTGKDTFLVTSMSGGVLYGDAERAERSCAMSDDDIKITLLQGGEVYGDVSLVVKQGGYTGTVAISAGDDEFALTAMSGGEVYGDIKLLDPSIGSGDSFTAGDDEFEIGLLSGGKIYGDVQYANSAFIAGDDEFTMETMTAGEIFGDAEILQAASSVQCGDDEFEVTLLSGGKIYGDAQSANSNFTAGDDTFTIGTMAGGELYGGVQNANSTFTAGEDRFAIETMTDGDIHGDAQTLQSTSQCGDDEFEIDLFAGGQIYGDVNHANTHFFAGSDTFAIETMTGGELYGDFRTTPSSGSTFGGNNFTIEEMSGGIIYGSGFGFSGSLLTFATNTFDIGEITGGRVYVDAFTPTSAPSTVFHGSTVEIDAMSGTAEVYGGQGDDVIEVKRFSGGKIDMGDGDDTVTIKSLAGLDSTNELRLGDGDDTVVFDFENSSAHPGASSLNIHGWNAQCELDLSDTDFTSVTDQGGGVYKLETADSSFMLVNLYDQSDAAVTGSINAQVIW